MSVRARNDDYIIKLGQVRKTILSRRTETLAQMFLSKIPCLMVIAGRQSLSSSNIERQTVPDGYTLG